GDGSVTPMERTMWSSHYGPMLNLPFGWTADTAYTMRDANIDNATSIQRYFGMDTASSMEPLAGGHRRLAGRRGCRRNDQARARQRGDPPRRLRPAERVGRRPGREPARHPPVQLPAAVGARRFRVQRQRLALAGQPGGAA